MDSDNCLGTHVTKEGASQVQSWTSNPAFSLYFLKCQIPRAWTWRGCSNVEDAHNPSVRYRYLEPLSVNRGNLVDGVSHTCAVFPVFDSHASNGVSQYSTEGSEPRFGEAH